MLVEIRLCAHPSCHQPLPVSSPPGEKCIHCSEGRSLKRKSQQHHDVMESASKHLRPIAAKPLEPPYVNGSNLVQQASPTVANSEGNGGNLIAASSHPSSQFVLQASRPDDHPIASIPPLKLLDHRPRYTYLGPDGERLDQKQSGIV